MRQRPQNRGVVVLVALLAGGCAERELTAAPQHPPSAWTWSAVWVAGVAAALVAGGLLTLPAWRRRGGARLAVAVLALQTGAVAVTGAVLTAVAARSWQLVDRPQDAPPATALLRLSRVDGDAGFLAAMTVTLAVLTVLTVAISAALVRLVRGTDATERVIAAGVLALEVGGSGYLALRLVLGAGGLPYLGGAAAFPVLLAALVTCWPRRAQA